MTEELANQSQDITTEPAAPVTDTTATEPAEVTPAPQTIKIKFNHEERELPLEEASLLAQKGMNYDKVYERLNQLTNDPALKYIDEMATRFGMDRASYIEALKQQEMESTAQTYQSQGIDAATAQKLAKADQLERELQKQKAEQAMFSDFIKEYPDVKFENIPAEVWQEYNNGKSLVDAYTRHELKTLKAAMNKAKEVEKAAQTNEQNAKASTGPIAAQGNVKEAYYTRQQVEKMSQAEVNAHIDEINASMPHWKT